MVTWVMNIEMRTESRLTTVDGCVQSDVNRLRCQEICSDLWRFSPTVGSSILFTRSADATRPHPWSLVSVLSCDVIRLNVKWLSPVHRHWCHGTLATTMLLSSLKCRGISDVMKNNYVRRQHRNIQNTVKCKSKEKLQINKHKVKNLSKSTMK